MIVLDCDDCSQRLIIGSRLFFKIVGHNYCDCFMSPLVNHTDQQLPMAMSPSTNTVFGQPTALQQNRREPTSGVRSRRFHRCDMSMSMAIEMAERSRR
jgi:hypothetical protein